MIAMKNRGDAQLLAMSVDAEEGLVNGSFATVSSILMKTTNADTFAHMIGLGLEGAP